MDRPDTVGSLAGDIVANYLPNLKFSAERMRCGEMPLWNPHEFIGMPLFGTLEYGPFYPLNLLAMWVPADSLHFISALVHNLFLGVFSYLFFRGALRAGPLAALIGASTLCASGWALSRMLMYPDEFRSAAYVPLVLLLTDKLLKKPGARAAGFLGIALTLQFLGGELEICARTGFLIAAWAGMRLVPSVIRGEHGPVIRRGTWLLAGGALSLGLAAVQLLPSIETAAEGARSVGGLSFRQAMQGGTPDRLVLFMQMLGGLSNGKGPMYVGAISILMAVYALLCRRAEAWLFTALAIIFFELLRGDAATVSWLAYHLPTGDWFRFPIRFLPFFVLSLGALGALGAQQLLDDIAALKWGAAGFLLVGLASFAIWNALDPSLESSVLTVVLAAAAGLAVLATWLPHVALPRGVMTFTLLAGIVVLPMLRFDFSSCSIPRNPNYAGTSSDVVKYIKAHARQGDRVYVDVCTADALRLPKFGLAAGVSCINGFSPFVPRTYWEFVRGYLSGRVHDPEASGQETGHLPIGLWGGLALSSDAQTLFALLRVRYIVVGLGSELFYPRMKRGLPDVLPEGLCVVWRDGDTAIIENSLLKPRAFVVEAGAGRCLPEELVNEPCTPVEIAFYASNRVVLRPPERATGWLVLTDQAYPGWLARVDGLSADVSSVGGLFRAVRIAPGTREVEFYYRPLSWRIGVIVSACSLAVLFLLMFSGGRLRQGVDRELPEIQ